MREGHVRRSVWRGGNSGQEKLLKACRFQGYEGA